MTATLLIVVCLIWVGLTVATHVSTRIAERVVEFDVFALVPAWSFFAPHPLTLDPHLIYRDKAASGEFGAFREAPNSISAHSRFRCIWNPDRRVSKSLFDALSELSGLAQCVKPHELKLSFPYLMLANYVMHLDGNSEAVSRQFAIVSSGGYDESEEPVLVFVSEFHALPKPD